MTVLTDQGLLLIAPEENFTGYFQELQFKKFQAYVDAETQSSEGFAWIQAEAEEYE